ncbi:zinc finger protein 567-like isoform X19 [Acanthochromis polyacanthus]|uniref:zinc finger protein 567-like isoform X19 n=1 Tax=Acanthochromis polyacanthus TaxID=80966 RepID=UPI0022346CB5|nr:zinc finger protein 567-like isoform X19 [Acanthochromis polyacanthus]
MSSVQNLRELINERLTAAAEEIFTEFEKTIVQYEEEIDRQRRLLDNMWKAEIKFHTTDKYFYDLKMNSVQNLRELINERLTAAAEEIFTVFEKTIVQYEEEIDRQRRLLDNTWKAEIKIQTTDLLQQHVQEENVLAEQNLCNQEKNSSVDQDDPGAPQKNEEQEELCTSGEGEHLALMQEANSLVQCESNCVEISREIFGVSDKPLNQSNEEIDYERRLVDAVWKPRIMLHRIDHPHQDVWKERNGLAHQQLCNQEKKFSLEQEDPTPLELKEEEEKSSTCLDQKDPETPQMKEEQKEFCISLDQKDPEPSEITEESEELCTSQQKQQIVLNQAIDTFLLTSADKDGDHSEREPNSNQLLSYNSPVAESPHEIKFKNHNSLYVHMTNHTGEKPYFCDRCGKSFCFLNHLTVHMRTHTGEKPYSCETCGKSFRKRYNLTVHMRTHTGERPYSCKTCGKDFSKRYHLTRHMRTHTGERLYSCKTCGQSFRKRNHLIVHLRTHSGEKPYSCKTCGKSFKTRGQVTEHMRTHTGERPYSCKTCGKHFGHNSSLTSHMRIHTGEKPYSCETCGKLFRKRSNVTVHMRTHTGETL